MIDPRRKREIVITALAVSAIVLGAVVSVMYHVRLDLTADRAFTLSETSRNLFKEIPEQVRVTYHVSKILADRHPAPAAIEDFLREIESVSRGAITVRVSDPGKDPAVAESMGVAPQQMQIVERSEQRLAMVYSGIVLEYLDRYETLPFIISADTLEYEFVKTVRSLITDTHLVAGLLVGDADKNLSSDFRSLAGSIERAGYAVREIQRGMPIELDVSVLFVLGNAAMDRYDAWFIDQFIMQGGRVFFAVKGVDINPQYGLTAAALPEGGLLSILSAYGIDLARELVLDQANLTVPFQTQNARGGLTIQYMRYPHWIVLDQRNANASHPITAKFIGLDLFWPSPIRLRPVENLTHEELAKTSQRSWLQTANYATAPLDEPRFALERATTQGQYLVAVAASGRFRSAFGSGDIPVRDGADPLGEPMLVSPDTRIVVVSSADFLTELLRMSNSSANISLALSSADWLASADDLIAIRSRGESDRRLNKIQDESLRQAMIALTYIVNLGIIPLGLAGFGLSRAWRRSRLERKARASVRGGEAA